MAFDAPFGNNGAIIGAHNIVILDILSRTSSVSAVHRIARGTGKDAGHLCGPLPYGLID